MADERRAAAEAAARLVVAALGDDDAEALDVLAGDVDPRFVAAELAAAAAKAMIRAYGGAQAAYAAACERLTEVRAAR